MSYKKYKISLHYSSKKTQGLSVGDIVRRQYKDGGGNIVYSLMCVLQIGEDSIATSDGQQKQPYFIGALLEGDVPKSIQLLDFVRVTNLFDTERMGALYLTSSEEGAPYLDVLGNIGLDASLSFPSEGISNYEQGVLSDTYSVLGGDFTAIYKETKDGVARVVELSKTTAFDDFRGIKQNFEVETDSSEVILISYKIKSDSSNSIKLYVEGNEIRNHSCSGDWDYCLELHKIEGQYNGIMSFGISLESVRVNSKVYVSDLNIIKLSSLSNYQEQSTTRLGNLSGITDDVFGRLSGRGGYMKRLFASQSVNIAGTLTAGDERGFGSTFYAGRINKNCFVNSLAPNTLSGATRVLVEKCVCGEGDVLELSNIATFSPQNSEWFQSNANKEYCLSFWVKSSGYGNIKVSLGKSLDIPLKVDKKDKWIRVYCKVKVSSDNQVFTVKKEFSERLLFSSPQLELGNNPTQYQPTDGVLDYSDKYGAWFNAGGIGGTMQNPLIRINHDGTGSITTRTNSFGIKQDGSGHLANGNISWDKSGNVVLGNKVKVGWDNVETDVKKHLSPKSIKILGESLFNFHYNEDGTQTVSPQSISLSVISEGFDISDAQVRWYIIRDGGETLLWELQGKEVSVLPSADYWGDKRSVTFRCIATYNDKDYSDVFTVSKMESLGYSVEVESIAGSVFRNGDCQTVLKANVYYNGKLIPSDEAASQFSFVWKKYALDMTEDSNWSNDPQNVGTWHIVLNRQLLDDEIFVCEISFK